MVTSKNHLMPPTQSLIQGQDTSIWLTYPNLVSDARHALQRNPGRVSDASSSANISDTLDALPLGDTKDFFTYGRYPAECYLHSDEANVDRTAMPVFLSLIRGRGDYQTSFTVASQNDLMDIRVLPQHGDDRRSLSWRDVSWKASTWGMTIRLARGLELVVRLQEREFRAFWRLAEYVRNIDRGLYPSEDEKLVFETRLMEMQYADSAKAGTFPAEKTKGPTVMIFERSETKPAAGGIRKMHRGFRMTIITDPASKTLSCVNHNLGSGSPFFFEYLTDPTAHGTTAIVIRLREEKRQFRILFVFRDAAIRQTLYDIVNGLDVSPDEEIAGKTSLTAFNVEAAALAQGFAAAGHPALQSLEWQKLGVTNGQSADATSRVSWTVQSENLRIVARHATGCITDRINLGKGELLMRLPCANTPVVQLYRDAQEDISLAVDTRNTGQAVSEGLANVLHMVRKQATVRTFTFATLEDLHSFQFSITNHQVRYDGMASTFGISRRRMVVPIYKKLEATRVRIQVVARESVVQVVAFMDDFEHADAMVFPVKSMDTFEEIKGDGKHRKWAVKLVDAKFSLPGADKEKGETISGEERVKRRFVNLEGLEYMGEHDDITIGFDSEQERNLFGQALPSAVGVSRGITLRRRI